MPARRPGSADSYRNVPTMVITVETTANQLEKKGRRGRFLAPAHEKHPYRRRHLGGWLEGHRLCSQGRRGAARRGLGGGKLQGNPCVEKRQRGVKTAVKAWVSARAQVKVIGETNTDRPTGWEEEEEEEEERV